MYHLTWKSSNVYHCHFYSQGIEIMCDLSVCLFSEAIWSSLLHAFVPLTSADFIWRRLVTALVTGVPDHCLESVLVPLVKQAPWSVLILTLAMTTSHHSVPYPHHGVAPTHSFCLSHALHIHSVFTFSIVKSVFFFHSLLYTHTLYLL